VVSSRSGSTGFQSRSFSSCLARRAVQAQTKGANVSPSRQRRRRPCLSSKGVRGRMAANRAATSAPHARRIAIDALALESGGPLTHGCRRKRWMTGCPVMGSASQPLNGGERGASCRPASFAKAAAIAVALPESRQAANGSKAVRLFSTQPAWRQCAPIAVVQSVRCQYRKRSFEVWLRPPACLRAGSWPRFRRAR